MLSGAGQGRLFLGIKADLSSTWQVRLRSNPKCVNIFPNDMSNYSIKPPGFFTLCLKVIVSLEKPLGSSLPMLDSSGTHHLSLILALLPDVTQHVSEFGLLLVHFIQAVLGILFLSFQLL